MNKITLLASMLLLSLSAPLMAKQIKISTASPDGTGILIAIKQAGKDIAAQTDNRVKLKFYPGGVMGDNKTVLKKIKRGVLHGALLESGAIAEDYKDAQVYNAPMAFNNFAEVDAVRSQLDADIEAGFEANGWQLFGLIEGGFAYAMTNAQVADIPSLKQQKLWLPANDPLTEKIAIALGLSPIYLGIGEVFTALQTGAINAIAAPPAGALTLQWYSKIKYVTDVPFMYTYAMLAISDKAYQSVSAADQQIMEQVLTAAIKKVDAANRADNLNAFAALKSQGVTIVEPNAADTAALAVSAKAATKILVEQGEISQSMLDRMLAILQATRSAQ